jgi:predicted secreted Zn-dependent protease
MVSVKGALSAAIFVTIAFSPAAAEPVTKYIHYPVTGSSITELYAAMLRHGPVVGGSKAFASVRMDPSITSTTKMSGKTCSIDSFNFNMTFTIQLPELVQATSVEPVVRASFNNFYEFAKKHEERHRAIWLGCAEETERLVRGAEDISCPAAETKSLKIAQQVSKRCDARHSSFDMTEQARLANHPFIQEARWHNLAIRSASIQLKPAETAQPSSSSSPSN